MLDVGVRISDVNIIISFSPNRLSPFRPFLALPVSNEA